MTTKEFNEAQFKSGDMVRYKGEEYLIAVIDFKEGLFGIYRNILGSQEDEISWVRCENCEHIIVIK